MLCCSLKKNIANICNYSTSVLSIYKYILYIGKAFAQTHRACMKETSQSTSARNKLTSPPNVPAKPPKTRPLRTSSSHQTLKRNTEKRYESVQRTARNNRKCIYAKRKIYIFVICGLSLEWSWGGRGAVATTHAYKQQRL